MMEMKKQIVKLLDVFADGTHIALVMEYVDTDLFTVSCLVSLGSQPCNCIRSVGSTSSNETF